MSCPVSPSEAIAQPHRLLFCLARPLICHYTCVYGHKLHLPIHPWPVVPHHKPRSPLRPFLVQHAATDTHVPLRTALLVNLGILRTVAAVREGGVARYALRQAVSAVCQQPTRTHLSPERCIC